MGHRPCPVNCLLATRRGSSNPFGVWHHLGHIIIANPGVAEQYLAVCAHNEHFLEYRDIVRQQIGDQLAAYRQSQRTPTATPTPVELATP